MVHSSSDLSSSDLEPVSAIANLSFSNFFFADLSSTKVFAIAGSFYKSASLIPLIDPVICRLNSLSSSLT
jgi:hypothetical protein